MHTFRRIVLGNRVVLGLFALLLLVPVSASSAAGTSPKLKTEGANGSAAGELSRQGLINMARYQYDLYARPLELQQFPHRLGEPLGSPMRNAADLLLLPNGRFLTSKGALYRQIPEHLQARELARAGDSPSLNEQRFRGGIFVIQFNEQFDHQGGRLLKEIEELGAVPSYPIPHRGYFAHIGSYSVLKAVAAHPGVRLAEEYHAALRLDGSLGREAYISKRFAERNDWTLDLELFPGAAFGRSQGGPDFEHFIKSVPGAEIVTYVPGEGFVRGRAIVTGITPSNLDRLLKYPALIKAAAFQPMVPMTTQTPAVIQTGHTLNNLLPFFGLGIDGDTQFLAVVDDGVSLDSYPFSHTTTQPDLNSSNDADPLQRPDVGPTHRKVESYRTVREINLAVGRQGGGGLLPGDGDFLSCDSPVQGSSTHGQVVAGLAVGNPSNGPAGLRIYRDNILAFFLFHQRDLPFDGVARGARLIFQDGHNTPPSTSSVACFTIGESDVNAGGGINSVGGFNFGVLRALLHEAAFRFDATGAAPGTAANWIPNARGARVHIIPFGVPNFDTNLTNGHDAYNANVFDVDDFLFRNRQSLVVLAAGNDGSDRQSSIGIGGGEVFPDPSNGDTYQIVTPATAKNGLVIGSHLQDATSFSTADDVENTSDYTSKGPATEASRRVAPLLLAPGDDGGTLDFSGESFNSAAVFRSNDNNQAGPIGGQVDFDGAPTDFVSEFNAGTSFAAAGAGGAAALVRDYFAKGFYPSGSRNLAKAAPNMSGALVKSVMIASANYADSDLKFNPLTVASLDRFSHVQGYGRIQLANALPLANYPEALLPEPLTHAEAPGASPTTPLGTLAVDEYFDGGSGLGVIAALETKTYNVTVIDSTRELRVGLAWADPPLDTLVHNLDLSVVAPVKVDTDGLPENLATCDPAGGSCRQLTFNGNQFLRAFSVDTRLSDGSAFVQPPCGPAAVGVNGRDVCNPTEAVILNPGQFVNEDTGFRRGIQGASDQVLISSLIPPTTSIMIGTYGPVTFLGEGDGILNDETAGGLNPSICSTFQGTNPGVATICSVARDLNNDGQRLFKEDVNDNGRLETVDGIPAGVWQIKVFARSLVATGATAVRNAPAGVPAAQKTNLLETNSPETGFRYIDHVRPFALFAAGGFLPAGASRAALNRALYDCADSAQVQVIDSLAGVDAASVSAATTLEVVRGANVEDSEAGVAFSAHASIPGAFTSRTLGVNRSTRPIPNNGILEVDNGDVLRARYTPAAGAGAAGQSVVECAPSMIAAPAALFGPDFTNLVGGGCDSDQFFDAGEVVSYTINLQNIRRDAFAHQDLTVALQCTNPAPPAGTESANPCQHLQILNSPVRVGRLFTTTGPESGVITGQSPTFNIFVRPTVRNVPDEQRFVDLSVVVQSATQDLKVTGQEPVVLTFRQALEADLEVFHYSTDHPDGTASNFVQRDLDRDGSVRPVLNPRQSAPGIGPILAITDNAFAFAISELAQETQKFRSLYETGTNVLDTVNQNEPLGQEIFAPPFDFDAAGDAANEGFFAQRSPHSKPGTGVTQPVSWTHSQNGVCGFQTQQAGRAGVWHAGGNHATLPFDGTCPNYQIPSLADSIGGNQFINDALFTPVINKVNQAKDARGFDFTTRLTRLAWNEQIGVNSADVTMMGTIDNNLDLDGNIDLLNVGLAITGELSIYQVYQPGPITQTNNLDTNAALQVTFGPRFDPDGSTSRTGGGAGNPAITGEEVGVSRPLREADTIVSRFLLPFPAQDANSQLAGFQRADKDRSTQAGPVRNNETSFKSFSVVPGYEDFWGPGGKRFQAALTWFVSEVTTDDVHDPGYGWTIDDLVMEWDESHPTSQSETSGTSCERIGSSEDSFFCPPPPATDPRCLNGILDLGEDVGIDGIADTGDFGEGDNSITRNGAGHQCASLVIDRTTLYDCNVSVDVTIQDLTPPDIFCAPTPNTSCVGADTTPGSFCRDASGRFFSPCDNVADGFVVVNGRTFSEPRGEEFRLPAVAGNPTLFRALIPISSVLNANDPKFGNPDDTSPTANHGGNVFIRPASDKGVFPSPVVFTYQDLDCDGDADGALAEDNFRDIDGDGVTNFDDNFDARPDDNCFITASGGDTYNPTQVTDAYAQTRDAFDHRTGALLASNKVVNEFVDTDNSLTYNPSEDRILGADNLFSFNGVLDPGEDLGSNLLADSAEPILGADGQPGRAGFDDDKNDSDPLTPGVQPEIDNVGETGWCGTDDKLGDNFRTAGGVEDPHNPGLIFPNACQNPEGGEHSGTLEGDVANRPDAFGDICDNCPLFFNPTQLDDDSDGVGNECEDQDLDDDGVPNTSDNCPTVFNPVVPGGQPDADDDGTGDACAQTSGPSSDPDGDGLNNFLDNCELVKNGLCNSADPAINLARCDSDEDLILEDFEIRNGLQRDSDFDAIGDACDPEDFDIDPTATTQGKINPDGVPNTQDNCPTFYNPRIDGVQEDTDGDGLGDSRGSNGPDFCDPDSTDDDNDGSPDDLVVFGLTAACDVKAGNSLGAVSLRGVAVNDCLDRVGGGKDGDCDSFADPGERVALTITIFNGLPIPLTNTRLGVGSTSESVACMTAGEAVLGEVPSGGTASNTTPLEFIVTTGDAAQLREDLPIGTVLLEPKRAVFTVSIRSDEIQGSFSTQTFALNHDLDLVRDPNLPFPPPFTYFESFENAAENTAADPRDCNGDLLINCGDDNDCGTGDDTCPANCAGFTGLCDEWVTPLTPEHNLRLINETFVSDNVLPETRGEARVVSPGSRLICPADRDNGSPINGIRPTSLDWHVHTRLKADINGTNTSAFGNQSKAFRGQNSLQWGRHVVVTGGSGEIGDTYCLQCLNAFVMDREGGFNLNISSTPTQPLRLSFWHIQEACDHECYPAFSAQVADDGIAIVEVRTDLDFSPGSDFGPWERIEPDINPYDGQQDTAYFTATYEPPDDINPLNQVDRETTMCGPLFSYIAQGSSKGTDVRNCQDGDGNGFGDCGYIAARNNPAERRPDRIAQGEAKGNGGVWAFTSFSLDRYAGRHIQVRWITTTLDSRDLFESYLETTGGPFFDPASSNDDGWYVDDVRISGLIDEELVFAVELTDGPATCPVPGGAGAPVCSISGLGISASPVTSAAPGTTVQVSASGIAVNCLGGETRFRWLRNGVEIQPYSSDNTIIDAPLSSATYTVEARCSAVVLPGCTASASTTVGVYDGGGSDSIVLRMSNATTVAFNAVQQPAGIEPAGYDLFRGCVRGGTLATGVCTGSPGLVAAAAPVGPGVATNYGTCLQSNLPQAALGAAIAVTDASTPPAGNALFYIGGHSWSSRNDLLGYTSNGKLRSATVACP